MVRSILLQVTRGRQIAQEPILQSAFRRPLCHPITFPEPHQFKNPRFVSPLFSTLFPMVQVSFLDVYGIH